MQKTIFDKQLPAFSGLVVLIISLVTIGWLSGNAILFGTKAANGNVPRDVQISNVTDSSFTVSYTTDEFAIGTIEYGTNENFGKVGLDDRDQQLGSPVSHRVHHITIRQLTPSTRYLFQITSGETEYKDGNKSYSIMTAPPSTEKPTNQPPAVGSVSLDDGDIPAEGLVYVSTGDSQLLSALLKPDGGYIVPLNAVRKKDLASFLTFTPEVIFNMSFTNGNLRSKASILASQTNPVPRVILSKDYTFTADDAEIDAATQVPQASESASFPTPDSAAPDTTQVSAPEIISPKNEEVFQDQKPAFSGKAIPNEMVAIGIVSVGAQETKTAVQADANGNWEYRPTVALPPGVYTIAIASVNSVGETVTVTNTFTINASGSQFTEPSISPSPSPIFDITPTASPTAIPTLSPTASPTPTLASPTPTNASPSAAITQPPIPQSGSESLIMVVIGTGLSIIVGFLLFLFSRGSIIV